MLKVKVYSFDCDDCLFNDKYIDLYSKRRTRSYGSHSPVTLSNKALLDTLKQEQNNYTESIMYIGSNRQSHEYDDINKSAYETESAFDAVPTVANYVGARFDALLLADIHSNVPAGVSFIEAKKVASHDDHKLTEWEDYKVTIIYAQMHKAAMEHPDKEIEFDFFDDRDDILNALNTFYLSNIHLIPPNVTLCLRHYFNGRLYQQKHTPLVGMPDSMIDCNYAQTVRDMVVEAKRIQLSKSDTPPVYRIDANMLENRKPLDKSHWRPKPLKLEAALYEMRFLAHSSSNKFEDKEKQAALQLVSRIEQLIADFHLLAAPTKTDSRIFSTNLKKLLQKNETNSATDEMSFFKHLSHTPDALAQRINEQLTKVMEELPHDVFGEDLAKLKEFMEYFKQTRSNKGAFLSCSYLYSVLDNASLVMKGSINAADNSELRLLCLDALQNARSFFMNKKIDNNLLFKSAPDQYDKAIAFIDGVKLKLKPQEQTLVYN